jgi:hypothetical protein
MRISKNANMHTYLHTYIHIHCGRARLETSEEPSLCIDMSHRSGQDRQDSLLTTEGDPRVIQSARDHTQRPRTAHTTLRGSAPRPPDVQSTLVPHVPAQASDHSTSTQRPYSAPWSRPKRILSAGPRRKMYPGRQIWSGDAAAGPENTANHDQKGEEGTPGGNVQLKHDNNSIDGADRAKDSNGVGGFVAGDSRVKDDDAFVEDVDSDSHEEGDAHHNQDVAEMQEDVQNTEAHMQEGHSTGKHDESHERGAAVGSRPTSAHASHR